MSALAEEPMIVAPSRAEVRAAIDTLPPELTWEAVSNSLRPMFVRRRPMPPGADRPLTFRVPPGVNICLGLDIGPAFLYVGSAMVDDWPVSADEALGRAMANLRTMVEAERYIEMEFGTLADIPVWWYQSHGGLASGVLLLEDELRLRYGDEPRLLVAPMRNLLLAVPFDADREMVGWLRDEIAYEDPNGLDLPIFAFVDGRLSIDRRGNGGGAPVH